MSFEVYSADYSVRNEISHAISIQYAYHYNDIGKFTIVLPIDDYNIAAIENNGILYETNSGVTFIIKNIKYDTTMNRLTFNGYTTNSMLNDRCITEKTHITNVETGIYDTMQNNLRGLPDIEFAPVKGLEEVADVDVEEGQLLDKLMPVLEEAELGNRMIWNDDTHKFIFEVYKGVDRAEGKHSAIFSDEYGTASNLIIQDDISRFCNVFYIKGIKRDNDRTEIVESIGDATGGERCEHWLARTVQQDKDESEANFRKRMRDEATEGAQDYIRRQNFTVEIDPDELGTVFNVGDIVNCVSVRFNIAFQTRITGIKYILDITGAHTSIILGEPTLTALGEVKL